MFLTKRHKIDPDDIIVIEYRDIKLIWIVYCSYVIWSVVNFDEKCLSIYVSIYFDISLLFAV